MLYSFSTYSLHACTYGWFSWNWALILVPSTLSERFKCSIIQQSLLFERSTCINNTLRKTTNQKYDYSDLEQIMHKFYTNNNSKVIIKLILINFKNYQIASTSQGLILTSNKVNNAVVYVVVDIDSPVSDVLRKIDHAHLYILLNTVRIPQRHL